MKRGRPRRFQTCPECGEKALRVIATRQAGYCKNVYCECWACGERPQYVETPRGGHWIRVRNIEDVGKS